MIDKIKVDYLVYSLTGLSSLQIGINAEVLLELKKNDKSMLIVECDAALSNCHFNHFHNIIACASCQTRKSTIYNQLGIDRSNIYKLKRFNSKIDIPHFQTTDELINFKYGEINIGRGVASSLISQYRKFEITSEKYAEIIKIEIIKCIDLLKNIEVIFKKYDIKEVLLFNGRFSEIHPLRVYCEFHKIDFNAVESGSKGKYEIFKNKLPHSIEYRHQSMLELWENGNSSKEQIGIDWYNKRRSGDSTYDFHTFKKEGAQNDKIDSLVDNSKKQNILILNSSEDEMKVIQEWKHGLYPNQNHAINSILIAFSDNEELNFILRIHPNLDNVNNRQTEELAVMQFPNLKIVYAHEDIDTYELMDKVDKIIVFGSSTGIEGTFMEKPVILYGKSFYLNLDVSYNPENQEELLSLILNDRLEPKPITGCLIYGHYMATYGKNLKSFEPNNSKNPYFLNKKIPTFTFKTLYYLVRYLKDIALWKKLYWLNYKTNLKLSDIFLYKFEPKLKSQKEFKKT